ncbi:MAG: FAD-dependent oxidoreductase [Sphingomonas sp.]|nr:MAG: FAD-dependent oxidoreductase [Sphingomonas sp.]
MPGMSGTDHHIDTAIIGGGFSGTLLAVNLVRHQGPVSALIERRSSAGLGLAYSTASRSHLLNVRAANMSALPDDPGHFERWAAQMCSASGSCFVPRADYGRYLNGLLQEAREKAPHQLLVRTGEVTGLQRQGGGYRMMFESGETLDANRVVLATGNLPARIPGGLDAAALGKSYVADPWQADSWDRLDLDAPILLIGTGLTAVDVALLLRDRGHRGPLVAVSRRGLTPRAHADPAPLPPLREPPVASPRAILRHLRTQSGDIGWRAAVDQLRPHSQTLWRKMPPGEKQRFLRHARPWWDVHRHRMAPEVAARVETMTADGSFRSLAARFLSARATATGAELAIRHRDGSTEELQVARVVNCTGPGEIAGSDHPLVRSLLGSGLARPDPLGMGIDTDHLGRVIGHGGTLTQRLFAVGPLTRGSFWEITAVPDIRHQVWSLARLLSNAHWVGGEGL